MDAQQTQENAADRPLHVFEIGPDTFIAHDAEDAWKLLDLEFTLADFRAAVASVPGATLDEYRARTERAHGMRH